MRNTHSWLQSAVEYLTTYGWAILLVAIVLAALYSFGFFNTANANQCSLGSELLCQGEALAPNGILSVTILQTTGSPINVTGIACAEGNSSTKFQPVEYIQNSSTTHEYTVQCYTSSASAYSAPSGSVFKGGIGLVYKETLTGYTHAVYGIVKVTVTSSAPGLTTLPPG